MSGYGWIITIDHAPMEGAEEGTNCNAKGVTGPRDVDSGILARLQAGEGLKFQIQDDDGELYYSGRFIGPGSDEGNLADEAFGPLHDFGLPNAGATEIHYKVGGKWVIL